MENLFETAVREKYVYNYRGLVDTSDLYDLPLGALDEIYKGLKGELRELDGDSLLETADAKKKETLENKVELVAYIAHYKQSLALEAMKEMKKKEIEKLIAEKKEGALKEKSVEELEEMLKNM